MLKLTATLILALGLISSFQTCRPKVKVAFRLEAKELKYLLNYNRVGVVLDPTGEAQELVSKDAAVLLRQLTGEKGDPITTAPLELELPEDPIKNKDREDYQIIFYNDSNRNHRFDRGESYIGSYTGGRGTYRVRYLKKIGEQDRANGAAPGWNIVEGGAPEVYHTDFDRTVIYINPAIRPIPG